MQLAAGYVLTLILSATYAMQDESSSEPWYVSRAEWLAGPPAGEMDEMMRPAPLVVINHSAGAPCYTLDDCKRTMRDMQHFSVHENNYVDVPYNFAIGSEGRVYEGRGWGHAGAHTRFHNRCALGIGYLGDYSVQDVTKEQVANMYKVLEQGVALGLLREDYVIVGHRDLRDSDSPGDKLYEVIRTWPQYNSTINADKYCEKTVLYVDNNAV